MTSKRMRANRYLTIHRLGKRESGRPRPSALRHATRVRARLRSFRSIKNKVSKRRHSSLPKLQYVKSVDWRRPTEQ